MTVEEVAKMLNGRECRGEVSDEEEKKIADSGIVVVFGASDDLCEFRGAICDEAGCYDGGEVLVTRGGLVEPHDDCECDYCGYETSISEAQVINAKWHDGDIAWTYETEIPHKTFDVMEDDEVYCRGIVFKLEDL